jgi:hypothetical protein
MPHAYTEDQLVEQSAIGLFAEPGWTTASALGRLNPALPPEAITTAVDELTRDRSDSRVGFAHGGLGAVLRGVFARARV